jgi:V8-like Glu-specific endopeptidase
MACFIVATTLIVVDALAAPPRVIGDSDQTTPLHVGPIPPDFTSPSPRSIPAPEDIAHAIGWMQGAQCTAFHIGQRRAVTAGHCVLPQGGDRSNFACGQRIAWAYQGDSAATATSPESSWCLTVERARNVDEDDYAVLLVDVAPSASIRLSTRPTTTDTPLQIAGYPSGPPLSYPSQGCSAHTGDETKVPALKGRDWIVAYKCDTDRGSSGSPVLRTDDWSVVGVHDAGIQTNAFNNDGWNWATAAAHVTAALATH